MSRSVAAQLSSKEDRARVMALLAVSQSVGFFVGPGKITAQVYCCRS